MQNDFEDRMRQHVEEADTCQGFQVWSICLSVHLSRCSSLLLSHSLSLLLSHSKVLMALPSPFPSKVITHVHDGFAGLAHKMLETLRDEYANKAIATFGVVPPAPKEVTSENGTPEAVQRHKQLVNKASLSYALAAANLCEFSSTFTPLSMCTSWRGRRGTLAMALAKSNIWFCA